MIGFFIFTAQPYMNQQLDDKELLVQFRDPASKERSFTFIIKKIPGKALLAYSPYGCFA